MKNILLENKKNNTLGKTKKGRKCLKIIFRNLMLLIISTHLFETIPRVQTEITILGTMNQ